MNSLLALFTNEPDKKRKLNRAIWWTAGIIFVLQMYFVRELLAAELLFGLAFAVLFSIGFVLYMIGQAGERGFGWVETHARTLAISSRRAVSLLQLLSRRTFRHLRSESAQ